MGRGKWLRILNHSPLPKTTTRLHFRHHLPIKQLFPLSVSVSLSLIIIIFFVSFFLSLPLSLIIIILFYFIFNLIQVTGEMPGQLFPDGKNYYTTPRGLLYFFKQNKTQFSISPYSSPRPHPPSPTPKKNN